MSENTKHTINVVCNECNEVVLTEVTHPTSQYGDWSIIKSALIDHNDEAHPETFEYECEICYQQDDGYSDPYEAAEALVEHLKDDHGGTVYPANNRDDSQSVNELV